MSISETVSEKPRRGRPRSRQRKFLDDEGRGAVGTDTTLRTQLSHVYQFATIGNVDNLLDDDDQRTLLGGTPKEILTGTGRGTPRGFTTFAVEFGRWSEYFDLADDTIRGHLHDVAERIRSREITFSDAAFHYQALRIGARAGSPRSLALHLARALDAFLRRYPATPPEAIRQALETLSESNERVESAESAP
jgi:hypothetical protein